MFQPPEAQPKNLTTEQEIERIYKLIDLNARHITKIVDTQIRILHYSVPHDKPYPSCPECAEVGRTLSNLGGPTKQIPKKRYEELLEIESKYKKLLEKLERDPAPQKDQ